MMPSQQHGAKTPKVNKMPKKKLTLRIEMRKVADGRLQQIESTARVLVTESLKAEGTAIDPIDVMRLASGTQTKTLRGKLITQLANEAEADLLKLWNNQKSLDLGESDANDVD